ncbi:MULTISPECIES: hypothetical protein [unclassified Thiomonas]|jgi:hypothetical protein|uniref:hypothetical protein n=1 Tax=unclassified Thiomonas TaxID=2625466 RepID=UPI0012A879B1|nr:MULTISPECIES: hypothetical protein [unclassified Thiomonas]VDY04321.1 membrane protein of unknown function [Thiomonas sp. Bio17B3]VDY08505.1 membrane protein of unknown function [Thiomonas sp. Sup16B3]VDY12567.1 conserved membrane protein of unknown function [Thiomonas sp. OC7]VDY18220.1 membrane protein of unknown function [Thiomonas sp. CB2]
MRLHSTPTSAHDGEITFLAIGECIAAVCLYTAIGVYLHTVLFYCIAIVLAPLTLLRTELSSSFAMAGGYTIRLLLTGKKTLPKIILIWLIGGPLLRVITTINGFFHQPIVAIRSMPGNWIRQALCTDIYHPPEIFQSENILADNFRSRLPTFPEMLRNARKVKLIVAGHGRSQIWYYFFLFFMFFPYIPSIIYRISFKATSIVYMPLVWASQITLRNSNPWPYTAERISKGKFEADVRKVSLIVLVFFVYKIGLNAGLITEKAAIDKYVSKEFVDSFLELRNWPWWEFALAANVILTYIIYYVADWAISMNDFLSDRKKNVLSGFFSFALFVRAALSIASVTYLVCLAFLYVFWSIYMKDASYSYHLLTT